MKSKKLISAAAAAAIAVSCLGALPVSAAEYCGTANVSAYSASAKEKEATEVNLLDSVIESGGYNVSFASRTAYKSLSSSEKKLYKGIVTAAKNLSPTVEIPSGLTSKQVFKVYTLVFHEEPELFWLPGYYTTVSSTIMISYKATTVQEITEMQEKINKKTAALIKQAKKSNNTYSKLKVFYDYLVLNNDFVLDSEGYNSSIYNAFVKSSNLQCVGYAKAMQYLCDLSGIKSTVVTGTTKDNESHAWNVVYCGDGYYNLDATWGDPMSGSTPLGDDYIQYEFFLVPDEWIKDITHFNENKVFMGDGTAVSLYTSPSCTKTKYNYFIKNNKNYSDLNTAKQAIESEFKTAVKNKKKVVEVRVTSKELYDKLMSDSYASQFSTFAKKQSSKVKSISKQSSMTGGVYVVHYNINYN